jgi:hypothetical protein
VSLVGRGAGLKIGRVARRRRCVLGRWRPCLSLAPGPDSRVAHCCHEHAGQRFGIPTEPPGSPSATRDGRRTVGASRPAGRGRRARGDRGPGRRDRCRQGIRDGLYPGAACHQGGQARHHGLAGRLDHQPDPGVGRPVGRRGDPAGRGRVHLRLLAAVRLCAGGAGAGGVAGQRPRRQAPAGPPQDRQAGCGVAGQAERAGHAATLVRPACPDPPAAGLHPAACRPDRRPHPPQAAAGAGCWRTP